jgi:peptide/nickel transport system permease protein
MIRFILLRVLAIVPTLLVASLVVFFTINLVPGRASSAFLGLNPTPEARTAFEARFGLDKPLPIQYLHWIGSVARGQFGISFQNGVPVGPELLSRLPVTLELAVLAILFATLLALPLGVVAAHYHHTRLDAALSSFGVIGVSMPNFWLATVLVLIFTFRLHALPPGGYVPFWTDPWQNLQLMAMPAVTLGVGSSALLFRIMRSVMIEILGTDYVRTAVAKGVPPLAVDRRHTIRNALIPFLTVGGMEVGALFGGAVIVEQIFLLPGVGSFALIGITSRDYAILEASVLLITTVVLVVNLLVDIAAMLLDPRKRLAEL